MTETNKSEDELSQFEAWLKASHELAARILAIRDGKPLDTDAILAEVKTELEDRYDFLRSS